MEGRGHCPPAASLTPNTRRESASSSCSSRTCSRSAHRQPHPRAPEHALEPHARTELPIRTHGRNTERRARTMRTPPISAHISAHMRLWCSTHRSPVLARSGQGRSASFCAAPDRHESPEPAVASGQSTFDGTLIRVLYRFGLSAAVLRRPTWAFRVRVVQRGPATATK
jgi:hypothetical protein